MSNLFSIGGAGNVGASEGIDQQSLKFNDDESQYLSWTPETAGNRRTWTWSGWVKRGKISGSGYSVLFGASSSLTNNDQLLFRMTGDEGQLFWRQEQSGIGVAKQNSIALFRDPSAWYHIVLAYDSTNATEVDRIKIYVNGVRIELDNDNKIELNRETRTNSTAEHHIGYAPQVADYFDGYMSNIHFTDGTAYDADAFGEFVDGYWKAKDFEGVFGTNGYHLTFQDDVVSEGFNAVTYRGDGSNGNSISGLGFSPDLAWFKRRDAAGYYHELHDTIRGANKALFSNATDAESTRDSQTSFDSDGFTVGTQSGAHGGTNTSGGSYVAWAWDAGSGSPVSNTDGTITSTVKANPAYGFSIVSYTGTGSAATIGHGLSSAPDMIITKARGQAENWGVYHSDVGNNKALFLNLTNAESSASNAYWNNASPTSSVFSVNTSTSTNAANTMIAYCFHSVAGYSSIGSYSGTDSAGVTVTTGFRPAFVMIKATNITENWVIIDNTRNPANPANSYLNPNLSSAEVSSSAFDIDFTDTGFVLQGTDDAINGYSGGTGEYIYMAFADTREAAFWKDVSGQGNHWTPNNLDYRDSLPDSPANNFAVLNPLAGNTSIALSEGNSKFTASSAAGNRQAGFGMSSGKWYWELYVSSLSSYQTHGVTTNEFYATGYDENYGYASDGRKWISLTASAYGASYTAGDILGFALDMDAGTFVAYKNGVSQGTLTSGLTGTLFPLVRTDGTGTINANFGQDSTFAGEKPMGAYKDTNGIGSFQSEPPSGFLALCTANLPEPTIVDGSEHFDTVLYTGDGTGGRDIGSLLFAPDFTWIKNRSSAINHGLFDTVRGAGERLSSNLTNDETTRSDNLTLFNSDGFRVNSGSVTNQSGNTYASWNWKAGGNAVTNTDGSITSQVSANTDAGFSIVSYTGTGANATVGHGLNSAPDMVIVKNRDESWAHWGVYHKDNGGANSGHLYSIALNLTGGAASSSTYWNNTAPTSSVFSIGTDGVINNSGSDNIAYCFHSSDVCKVGSYIGGGSNFPFVYTGFRPAWIMIKNASATSDWWIFDTVRDTYNRIDSVLYADLSAAEFTDTGTIFEFDLLSNGFKNRSTNSTVNGSGATYIYLAFAETPQKFANAR